MTEWFALNPDLPIESFVILDDNSDMLEDQKKNFVQTCMVTGLSDTDVEKAIKILQGV